jgi:hypothetical protein
MMNMFLTIWRILTYGIGRRRRLDQQWYGELASWFEDDEVTATGQLPD